MKLLLDTHIWIWSDVEAHKLSSDVARELGSPENERYLSAVSVWEAILLLEKKRIRPIGDFGEWFEKSKLDLGLIEVPLNWEIAHEVRYTILGRSHAGDGRRTVDERSGIESFGQPLRQIHSIRIH